MKLHRTALLLPLLLAYVPFVYADDFLHPAIAITATLQLDAEWQDDVQRRVTDDFDSSSAFMFGATDSSGEFYDGYEEPKVDEAPAEVFVRNSSARRKAANYRMPAEFETQSGLMVSGERLASSAPTVLTEISRATTGHIKLWMLVSGPDDLDFTSDTLAIHNSITPGSFLMVQHDTMWVRDYGPTVLESKSRTSLVVDASYDAQERRLDDAVPTAISHLTSAETRHTSLNLPGGNLLTNGRGVIITTTRVQQENAGTSQADIVSVIGETYDASTIAVLEPLDGESTGHVDMFATFTDEHTVVVGEYARHVDSVNSRILDRNAERLASIQVGRRKLRVVRIPMPSRRDGLWPTFTNVVYANGLLLVPCYESTTPRQKQAIHAVYLSLLPDWRIHFIQCDDLINSGGALHCVVSNLNSLSIAPSAISTRFGEDRRELIRMQGTRSRLAFRN